MRITKKKLKELIREENQATKMYKGYGLFNISRDEARHRKELIRLLNRKRK